MKLNNTIPQHPLTADLRLLASALPALRTALRAWTLGRWRRHRSRLVRQFGQARLVKLPNGEHQLLGGSDADRAAAFEWVSLFAHEIVFTHFHREAVVRRPKMVGRVALRPPFWKRRLVAQPV